MRCYFLLALDMPHVSNHALPWCSGGTIVRPARKEFSEMRELSSYLRVAAARIGHRLAAILAIAAASLPAAGA